MLKNYNNTFFFTATILEWKKLLAPDKYKDVIIESMKFLVEDNRVKIYGFIIMPNHIHIIWHLINDIENRLVQSSLLRFTANQIKKDLAENHTAVLEKFKVNAKDRMYQIWERNPLSVPVYTDEVMKQKLEYIHHNPCNNKWNLATTPQDYYYSSAKFYNTGENDFGFLTSYVSD